MIKLLLTIVLLAASVSIGSSRADDLTSPMRATTTPVSGDETLKIFTARCVQCHAADLARPKGKFGYVLDLRRLAGNPELIVPFHPESSKLWQLIADDEMPPEEAMVGPLSEHEKSVIRNWIVAGAPAPTRTVPEALLQAKRTSVVSRSLGWVGRFHVVVVHFPIALLLAAAAGEAALIWRGGTELVPAVRFCVRLGAVGAIAAATLGWTRVTFGGYHADTAAILAWHRWIGTAACGCAIGAALLSGSARAIRSWPFRACLFSSAALVGLAGHLGGLTVYGENFFRW